MPAMPSVTLLRSALRPRGGLIRRSAAGTLTALALAALALAACGPQDDQFAPACPALALLPDAADISRFNGQGIDITNLVTRARITAVPARCERGDDSHTVRATLHVNTSVSRGPASSAASPPISYFVAVMQGNRVLREQDFTFIPSFPPNVDHASLSGDDIELLLPVSKTKTAAAYRIFVGFRLTPDELAYNRTHRLP